MKGGLQGQERLGRAARSPARVPFITVVTVVAMGRQSWGPQPLRGLVTRSLRHRDPSQPLCGDQSGPHVARLPPGPQ